MSGAPRPGAPKPAPVRRYWPGRAPDWAGAEEEEEGLVRGAAAVQPAGPAAPVPPLPTSARPPIEPPSVVVAGRPAAAAADPRLARLADVQVRKGERR